MMNFKNYSEPYKIFTEAFIDVALKQNSEDDYSDLISIWGYDFDTILAKIPLNEDGM